MDKERRQRIERATQAGRRLLEVEFGEQLQGEYDIFLDGRIAAEPGVHLDGRQRILRTRLIAAIQHKIAQGMAPGEAVADWRRDAAFTFLNRMAALRMLEARDLVLPAVGEAASGFQEWSYAAEPFHALPEGRAYRLHLECLFDELSREVAVLFDRRDPAALLWPRRPALTALVEVLSDPALDPVWGEDETIGWVYQYFNSGDERREMRDIKAGGSQAPRNARELAVRNQFFTPRWVVEFLADNTLGRLWWEMRGGRTALAETCRHLVWRPDETPRFRPAKDPRDLRVLDPACGSGHFLLYAFDLLAVIYDEAWRAGDGPPSGLTGRTLREDHPEPEAFRRALPGLILAHNLFGIDIDPRCAQIAALALWMRAQRAHAEVGVPAGLRPPIRRTNIVVAEPMPGEADLLDEFAGSLRPPVLGGLFRTIVDRMRLAGDLGSLLKIELALADAIAAVRAAWTQGDLLEGGQLVAGIDDAAFFDGVEDALLTALDRYVAGASDLAGTRRRLFVGDALHGLGFLHLMRRKYDVVLMNPPFGACAAKAKKAFEARYPHCKKDVLAAMVERGVEILADGGKLGAITSRTPFFLSSLESWRYETLLDRSSVFLFADFGIGVLDATVETAAFCLEART
ncbi:MAG: SAM-dependent methyltransferase [Alphaproteobacteria bacterium]|nr:SAM-dependent methyltransferase [Alphaproteobacteria bacterium]